MQGRLTPDGMYVEFPDASPDFRRAFALLVQQTVGRT